MPEARMCDLRFISQPVADGRHPDVYEYRRLIVFKFNIHDFVDSVVLEDTKNHTNSELNIRAIFTYIGTEPKTTQFKNILKLDDKGYIYSDENMNTNIKGVFVAGDVRKK